MGGMDYQTVVIIQRHIHTIKGNIVTTCLSTIQSAQRYMRECFRHPVRTPHEMREVFQRLCQVIINSTATDYKVPDVHQLVTFFWYLQGIIYLHGNHGGKVDWLFYADQRMSAGLHSDQSHLTFQGSHHHHLPRDIIGRKTKQGSIPFLQSEEVARDTGRCQHSPLLHPQRLGLTRRAAGVHKDLVAGIVPRSKKTVYSFGCWHSASFF